MVEGPQVVCALDALCTVINEEEVTAFIYTSNVPPTRNIFAQVAFTKKVSPKSKSQCHV